METVIGIKQLFPREVKDRVKEFAYPRFFKRRFHAYCVGTMKSGTTSFGGLFETNFRSRHEPEPIRIMELALRQKKGLVNESFLRRYLQRRDRRLWVDMESSLLIAAISNNLAEIFPDAKFILTLRDCYSWLDSCFNHQVALPITPLQEEYLNVWAGVAWSDCQYGKPDAFLEEHGIRPVEYFFRSWTAHNKHVLDSVPPERLLVVRTRDINSQLPRTADFLGIKPQEIDQKRSHLFKARVKLGYANKVGVEYLDEMAAKYCGNLMEQYYPEIKSAKDILSP